MFFLLIIAGLIYAVKRMFEPGTPLRLGVIAFLSAAAAHFALRWLPHTSYAEGLLLVAVGAISIVALAGMIHQDHQRGGISHGNEELLLVAVTFLSTLTLTMAWRIAGGGGGVISAPPGSGVASHGVSAPAASGYAGRLADSGCIPGSGRVCIVEEWYW